MHVRAARAHQRILVMVAYGHAGDALRVAPYVRTIRERHPSAEIVLLASTHTFPVYEGAGVSDRTVVTRLYEQPASARRWHQLWAAGEVLRVLWQLGVGYDQVIIFWWGATLLQVIARIAGWRGQRIGYASRIPWLLTSRLGVFPGGAPTPQHLRLLQAAGITDATAAPPAMRYTDRDRAWVAALLAEQGLNPEQSLVVLHTGSDWACQQWLPERWAELADEIAGRYNASIVFTGVAGEAEYIEDVRRRMHSPSVSLAGRTSLAQLAALLARARLAICIDSAAFELTQAVGTPAVVLAGPTAPQHVVPGRRLPVIVNPLDSQQKDTMNGCRAAHDAKGGCLDYSCPMAGLRQIAVADALDAVARQAEIAGLCACVQAP